MSIERCELPISFVYAHLLQDLTDLARTYRLGPSEFHITGTLKTWSVIDKVHAISVPTLLTNGAADEAQDECVEPFFDKIPKVK